MEPPPTVPPKRHFPWLTIILVVLALIALIVGSDRNGGGVVPIMFREGFGMGDSIQQVSGRPTPSGAPSVGMMEDSVSSMIAPDYYYDGDVPVTDTREFLKTDYSATMLTRKVQYLTRKAETIVRGHDGRIDSTTSSEKHGYISFVVPMSEFEQFRDEIESLVKSRFLTVQISQQNLLPQKQHIEETQKQVEQNVADLREARQKAITTYNSVARNLEAQLAKVRAEINTLSANPDDPANQARLAQLEANRAHLQSQLSSEKTAHASKLASYDNQIIYADTSLTAIKNQDQKLLDSVATVRGTLSFQWISLWDIARLYLPGPWIPAILAALAALAFIYERRLYFFKNY